MRPSTPHGLLPTPPPATLPTSLRHHCRLASLHHWRRTLPPPPVPTTASCPYRPRPSHPSRPRSHPAARRPPRCRRSPTRPTSATTAPSCVSRLTRSSAHSLPPSPPRCASSSATARRRLRRKYLPRARGVPPRVPLRPATYRPSLNTSGSSAPLDAPTDEFGGSFALIRVTAVSASTEEPSGGRSAAHIADGSGLRHYVEGAAYDGTPPAIYHPMPPPARRQTPAAQIPSPLPTMARFHAPTCTPPRSRLHAPSPPASLPLYPPAPRPSSLLSSTHRSTSHVDAHARLSAGRFVGGRYTPLPGGPGGAGDDAPSRPGTTVNSFCDAPHGLECGGLCWGSDVRVRSALHGGIAL